MADSILSVIYLGTAETEEMGKHWLKRGVAPIVIFGNVEDSKYVRLLDENGQPDINNTHVLEVNKTDHYTRVRNNDCEDFVITSSIYGNNNAIFTTSDGQVFDIKKEINNQLELQKDNNRAR